MREQVYAILLSNGICKVGRTKNLGSRMQTLAHGITAIGVDVDYFFCSAFIDRSVEIEQSLIKYMSSNKNCNKQEYFKDVNFKEIEEMFNHLGIPHFVFIDIKSKYVNQVPTFTATIAPDSENLDRNSSTNTYYDSMDKSCVLKLLEKHNELSEGVIRNRVSHRMEKGKVTRILNDLFEQDIVSVKVEEHPKNKRQIKFFKIKI